ncbi:hypothetical protein CLAIMM_08579 [Cladophialophora immunda]|nr:hypothetical protein CLAIMM_08579 [Cladophialophora immunda]
MAGVTPSEQSFKQMWDEAEERFVKITKKPLRSSPKKSLNDVIQDLENRYNESGPADDERNKPRAKELVENVLNCIKLLGGIAAQGASIVFGPANLCYSAVSFLIDIPSQVSSLYDGLADLFQRIFTFLKTFQIYQRIEDFAEVDLELKQTTHKLMISFVTICALSIKVLGPSKLRKAKIAAKLILFGDDSGVGAELSKFKKLVEANSQISDAVTLEVVLESHHDLDSKLKVVHDKLIEASEESGRKLMLIATGLDALVKAENERKLEKAHQDQVDALLKKLSIKMETVQACEQMYQNIRAATVRSTGIGWLHTEPEYETWIRIDSKPDSLLLLTGGEKSGKSFLVSTMINQAASQIPESMQTSMRVSIAYYYFPEPDEKPSRETSVKETQLPTTALKSMAVQIAKHNSQYAKEMAALGDKQAGEAWTDLSCNALWQTLQLAAPKKDVTYFLFFDGLDHVEESKAQELLQVLLNDNSPRLRIMASCNPNFVEKTRSKLDSIGRRIPRIAMEWNNWLDIAAYVEYSMKHNNLLQGKEEETVELLDYIKGKVLELSNGNYDTLRRLLDEIKGAISADKSHDEIRAYLDHDAKQTEPLVAQRTIDSLNAALEPHEITQLNELLAWVIYGKAWFKPQHLKGVLVLFYGRTPAKTVEDKLDGVYRKVLRVDSDGNVVVDSEIEKLLTQVPRVRVDKDTVDDTKPLISMTITINRVDVDTVRRFLWDLSEKANFGKSLPFDALVPMAQAQVKPRITANRADGQLTMTRRCMKLLMADPDSRTESLIPYALKYLPRHLQDLRGRVDEDGIDMAERKEIGRSLVSLLFDTGFIEKHWALGEGLETEWLDGDFLCDALPAWLRDSATADGLLYRYRQWVEQAVSSENPGIVALKDITLMVGRQWLCDRKWENIEAMVLWMLSYLSPDKAQVAGVEVDSTEAQEDAGAGDDTQTDEGALVVARLDEEGPKESNQISRAAEWVEKELKVEHKTSLWYERLGQSFLAFSMAEAAKESYQQAQSMPNASWKCGEGLALAFESEGSLQSAVDEMTSVVSQLKSLPQEQNETNIATSLRRLGGWQVQLGHSEEAISAYREVVELDLHDYETCWTFLGLLIRCQRAGEALEILICMIDQRGNESGATRLGELFMSFSSEHLDSLDTIFSVARRDKLFKTLLETVLQAVELARKKEDKSPLAYLLFFYGVAIAHPNYEDRRPEEALRYWEELCRMGFGKWGTWVDTVVSLAARFITAHHFSQALAAHKEGKDSTFHISNIEELIKRVHSAWYYDYNGMEKKVRTFLGSYYARSGQNQQARKVLQNDMRDALLLLSDDDPDNDWQGYIAMAEVSMHAGDDLNALSAWSLLAPKEVNEESAGDATTDRGDTIFSCDGNCGRRWSHADDMYMCKICPDVELDAGCLEKLKTGTLNRYICDASHDWLHVPSWPYDNYRVADKGKVVVGGEMADGRRVGGEKVPVNVWIQGIYEQWGIPKPERDEAEPDPEPKPEESTV